MVGLTEARLLLVESGCWRTDRAASTFRELTIRESEFVRSGLRLRQRVQQGRLAHHGDAVEGVQVLGSLFPQQGCCFDFWFCRCGEEFCGLEGVESVRITARGPSNGRILIAELHFARAWAEPNS